MILELKNFYAAEVKNEIRGSMHLKVILPSVEFELKGILCFRNKKGSWTFQMPKLTGFCPIRKHCVPYYIFRFSDPTQNKALFALIQEKAPAFIEEALKTFDSALEQKGEADNPFTPEEPQSLSQEPLPKPIMPEKKTAPKLWMDPPKRSGFQRSASQLKQKIGSR